MDDPGMLYCLACASFFLPLVGFITMCVMNCGSGLPPAKATAFKVMCVTTILSFFWIIPVNIKTGTFGK